MVSASFALVVVAILTLIFGYAANLDPLLFISIASSVFAGLLLIKSVIDDRKQRVATSTASPGPAA